MKVFAKLFSKKRKNLVVSNFNFVLKSSTDRSCLGGAYYVHPTLELKKENMEKLSSLLAVK